MPAPRRRSDRGRGARRGFTLTEMIIATVVLAIIAAMVLPRLTAKTAIATQLAGEQMADLLATFAMRSGLTAQPVALLRDEGLGTLEIWVRDIDPEDPALPTTWRPDRLTRPVSLPAGVDLVEVRVDSQRLMPDAWKVVAAPGVPRPRIELVVAGNGMEIAAVLEPFASAPYLVQDGVTEARVRTTVDLDRAGRDREIW